MEENGAATGRESRRYHHGKNRLEALNKKIGDRFTLHSFNYKGIELEVQVVGVFPVARYDNSCALDIGYFQRAMDAYPTTHNGQQHPMVEKSLNLVWLRVPDRTAFDAVAGQITSSPHFRIQRSKWKRPLRVFPLSWKPIVI